MLVDYNTCQKFQTLNFWKLRFWTKFLELHPMKKLRALDVFLFWTLMSKVKIVQNVVLNRMIFAVYFDQQKQNKGSDRPYKQQSCDQYFETAK